MRLQLRAAERLDRAFDFMPSIDPWLFLDFVGFCLSMRYLASVLVDRIVLGYGRITYTDQ